MRINFVWNRLPHQRCLNQGLFLLLIIALVSACGGGNVIKPNTGSNTKQSDSRYTIKHDSAALEPRDVSQVPEAVPSVEPYSRGGNKPTYQVWGKSYSVLPSGIGFREQGIASWYGRKFHGHLTSNGETYDMFAMSAAHKNLPLPSYARITNLENGKMVIVRVNDRGPFHGNRIIDLSYAAASKLDYHKKGVANVLVEAIDASTWSAAGEQLLRRQRQGHGVGSVNQVNKPVILHGNSAQAKTKTITSSEAATGAVLTGKITKQEYRSSGYFVQVGAFSSVANAINFANKVTKQLRRSDIVAEQSTDGRVFRVLIGPISDQNSVLIVKQQLESKGYVGLMII